MKFVYLLLASRKNELEHNLFNLLPKVTVNLAVFLGKVLPTLSNNWWDQNVLQCLQDGQCRRIEQQGIDTLAKLDLAMLLHVFDENWFDISRERDLKPAERHFVKEMKKIRNRCAHTTAQGIPPNDEYRELDTLLRFAQVIRAEDTFLQEVRNAMLALLPKIEESLIQDGAIPPAQPEEGKNNVDKIPTSEKVYITIPPPIKRKRKKENPNQERFRF